MNVLTQLLALWLTAVLAVPAPQTPAQQPAPPTPQQQPAQQQPAQQQPAAPVSDPDTPISLRLENANLLQVVSILAGELKMNYVVDPAVKGTVTINTLGEVKRSDLLPLLQTILRINGATAVETGSGLWRILPSKDAVRLPITPQMDAKDLPADERMLLNVVPMRFVSAADMSKILGPYLSDAGNILVHEAGNVLLIQDTSRSLRRLMELLNLFDSEAFTGQRVRLFALKNSSAKELVPDLQTVFSAYALSEKSALRFLPIERLNSLLVISPNPAAFAEVEKWLAKMDVAQRSAATRNYVYKVQNARALDIAEVLASLYGQNQFGDYSSGAGGATQFRSSQQGALGAGGGGGQTAGGQTGFGGGGAAPVPTRLVGMPLARSASGETTLRIVPDPINNMIIVQCTPSEWEEIRETMKELDVIPRQVLIEARIYEVDLTGALSMGVSAYLQNRNTNTPAVNQNERKLQASFDAAASGLTGSIGQLVGRTRELLVFLNAQESRGITRVLSAPSILASDNQDARIQVGSEIPILTSVGFTGAQAQGGGSVFTNTISNKDTGVILTVQPRVNTGGLVTLRIAQEVSVAQPPSNAAVPSPTIQKRSINTNVTIQDGETIALGGIIQEQTLYSRTRVPLLGDIPYLGALFGSTTNSKTRTELIVLLTPRVINNMTDAIDRTEALKNEMKSLRKILLQQESPKPSATKPIP